MSAPASEAFKTAVAESKMLKVTPDSGDLLELYSLYKIANGEDISAATAPGMFDFKEKEKRRRWQAKVDEGLTPEQAQESYVKTVEQFKEKYGFNA